MKKFLTVAIALAVATCGPVGSAHAVDYGVHIFMSAPEVQGSPLASDFTTETFDSYSTGSCPSSIAIGTVTGTCIVKVADAYGGASGSGSSPSTGGSGTKYATMGPGTPSMTVELAAPAKYLGLWWSAGSPTNTITFYSAGEEVAQMTTATLMSLLGNSTQTAFDGVTTYSSVDYYGNPVNGLTAGEPFLFLNVYAVGGTSFDSFTLVGAGFEFDNITVSDLEQTIDTSLVEIEFIEGLIPPDGYVDDGGGSGGGSGGDSESGVTNELAATGIDATLGWLIALSMISTGLFTLYRGQHRGRASARS